MGLLHCASALKGGVDRDALSVPRLLAAVSVYVCMYYVWGV